MQLIDRYLKAVRFWLPANQEDDIIAELGQDLLAETQDRQSDLGRPLRDDEISAILKRRGDPVLVAGSYLEIKPLISASLMPIYWFVLRLVTLWILVPCFLLIVGPIAASDSSNTPLAWLQTIWNLLMDQVFAFGVITVIFASLDRSAPWNLARAKAAATWDPARLPDLPASPPPSKPISRPAAIAELVAGALFGLLWLGFLWGSGIIHVESVKVVAAPVWFLARWLVLASCLASIAVAWFALIRPYAVRAREWMKLAVDGWNLSILTILLLANQWTILKSDRLPPEALATAVHWTNFGIRLGLGIAVLFTGYHVVDRLLRLTRHTPASHSTTIPV